MRQGPSFAEASRHFHHDDFATLQLAREGLDRVDGTADDYQYSLRYVGLLSNSAMELSFLAGKAHLFAHSHQARG